MADEDERRFRIGDEIKVRKGISFPEMKPGLSSAVGVVGDVADRRTGQTVTVMYRAFGFYAANLPARTFELVRRVARAQPNAPLPRRHIQPQGPE